MQQLNSSLEFIKKTSSDELVNNHLKLVFDTYYKFFGEVCTGCPTKIAGYISRLKKQDKNIIMKKDTRKFRLKKGAIIPVPGTSKAYSDVNITDEIALDILKINPNRKSIFSKLPSNLDELLEEETDKGGDEDVVKIGDGKFTLEEVLKILELNEITTKATTITGVQKKVDKVIKEGTVIKTQFEPVDLKVTDSETIEKETDTTDKGGDEDVK